MQSQDRPSYARRIALTVIAVCLGLILLGSLLPNPKQRVIAGKRRRLEALIRAEPRPLATNPVFVRYWNTPSTQDLKTRPIVAHAYLRIGVRTEREDLLQNPFMNSGGKGSRTILHLAFDAKKPDELRLATALAAQPGDMGLLLDTMLVGRRSSRLAAQLGHAERAVGAQALAVARRAVLAELADGSATACSVGTVLYEAEGHFYYETVAGSKGLSTPYGKILRESYEVLDALGDREVSLP